MIFVEIESTAGAVKSFVVKLVCVINEQRYEIIRYDCAHEGPHKDILDIDGHVIRKVCYDYLSRARALDAAIDDIEDNYDAYKERFLKWLKSRQ